ncbi:MAG: hypothetical protein CMN00_07720 [Rickettsiales bacterium]|nr:hypothetical protein [Rickettsiales bacterium]
MEKKVIHEHRLSTHLMVILGIFAFGIVMIGIDGYLIKEVLAELNGGDFLHVDLSGSITTYVP